MKWAAAGWRRPKTTWHGSSGRGSEVDLGSPSAAHFIYIPVILLIGIVIGWVLGSRAAADAIAMEQRKRDERAQRQRNA